MRWIALFGVAAGLAVAGAASAQPAAPESSSSSGLEHELDEVLKSPQRPSQTAKSSSPAGSGLLNPDISVIADAVGGYLSKPPLLQSGDDPLFEGPLGHRTGGVTLQELEIGFQSTVDPYFSANAFLTIPNLEGVEVEEAYATTTSLPLGLQVKAGVFRSSAGRQNEQHLHTQDFSRRPLINDAYLGFDGLRPPGAQLSWLAPLPFYLRVTGEILSVAPGTSATFGGSLRSSPSYLVSAEGFAPLSESWSLNVGLTGATGHAPPPGLDPDAQPLTANGPSSLLGGADLYLKYRPPNHVAHYFSFALQAEYFARRVSEFEGASAAIDAGFYAQLVAQLTRRWHAGVRYDLVGAPASALQSRVERVMGMAMFTPSEFSRIRLQASRQSSAVETASWEALLLLEYSIGAHGAHPF
jgi:hypothetical protein